jgi:hypothetical protein
LLQDGAAVRKQAEGQERAATRAVTARRKAAALATKWANRLQVAAKDRLATAAKVFGGTISSYVGLSPEEVAALKAAKKEAEAGRE